MLFSGTVYCMKCFNSTARIFGYFTILAVNKLFSMDFQLNKLRINTYWVYVLGRIRDVEYNHAEDVLYKYKQTANILNAVQANTENLYLIIIR